MTDEGQRKSCAKIESYLKSEITQAYKFIFCNFHKIFL
jgi:hypothetical protein